MQILSNRKQSFVRVIIGMAETGYSGVKAPTKTINVEDASVEEVYEAIYEAILNVVKKKKK